MKKSQQETVRDNEKQRETVRDTTRDRDTHTRSNKREKKSRCIWVHLLKKI